MQCKAIQRGTGVPSPSIGPLSTARRKPVDMRDMKKFHQHKVARKKPTRSFTDKLSPEAREAMQSTKAADEVAGKQTVTSLESGGRCGKPTEKGPGLDSSKGVRSGNENADQKTQNKSAEDEHQSDSSCKMADIYDKISPCDGPDRESLTIEDTDILNQHVIRTARGHIRAIGGGKVTSAMETVEVVIADEPPDYVTQPTDEEISDEMKRASVEKCLVWMEANERMQEQSKNNGAETD